MSRLAFASAHNPSKLQYMPIDPPSKPLSPLYLRSYALNSAIDLILPATSALSDSEYVLLLDADVVA